MKIESFFYNSNKVSFKQIDTADNVDISEVGWSIIFDSLSNITTAFYFIGERLEYISNDLLDLIEIVSEKIFYKEMDLKRVVCQIKASHILLNRKQLSSLWLRFEYPAIILCQKELMDEDLKSIFYSSSTYEEIAHEIGGSFIIHRNFENNVLWVQKSTDLNFPFAVMSPNR